MVCKEDNRKKSGWQFSEPSFRFFAPEECQLLSKEEVKHQGPNEKILFIETS